MSMSRRALLAFAAATTTGACVYTSKNVSLADNPSPETIGTRLEVRTNKAEAYVIRDPVLRGDSLYGWVKGRKDNPVAVAVADIYGATSREYSAARSALAIALVTVGVAGVWLFLLATSSGPTF